MRYVPGLDAEIAIRLLMRKHNIDRYEALRIYLRQRKELADALG
jgi:hypothetical protein